MSGFGKLQPNDGMKAEAGRCLEQAAALQRAEAEHRGQGGRAGEYCLCRAGGCGTRVQSQAVCGARRLQPTSLSSQTDPGLEMSRVEPEMMNFRQLIPTGQTGLSTMAQSKPPLLIPANCPTLSISS